jgi:hypothetical protein
MPDFFGVVVTDYGVVRLSKKTNEYLCNFDPKWQEIIAGKKARSKKAKRVKIKVAQLERAIFLAAEMAWQRGEELKEF